MTEAPKNRRGLTNGFPPAPARGTGRTNGLVNGLGRTNGLVNGVGRTNGLVNGLGGSNGLTNGQRRTGLVNGVQERTNGLGNGKGAVNGSGFINGLSLRRNRYGIITHRDLRGGVVIVLFSILGVAVLGFLLSAPPTPRAPFAGDGDF